MKISSQWVASPEERSSGAAAFLLRADDPAPVFPLGERESRLLSAAFRDPSFRAGKGKIARVTLDGGPYSCAYLIGLGPKSVYGEENIRSRTAELLRRCRSEGVEKVTVFLPDPPSASMSCAVAEGAELGSYNFGRYRTVKAEDRLPEPLELVLPGGDAGGISMGMTLAASQNRARDLANEPGNRVGPRELADVAIQWGREAGLDVDVWDEERLKREGMEGLLSVGGGSLRGPRLIHVSYRPSVPAGKKVVLVGKGITFDSGGINLKPGDFLRSMKGDKSGACCVLSAVRGLAELRVPAEVHGIVAAAENMPGGASFRPDDIIRMRNGKTVEIDNTDAEGRLVLADALCLASELKPDIIIDVATLTGACAVALGTGMAGLFSQDDAASADFLKAAERRGERFWRMPLDDERIAESLKSPVADLVNSGGRYGGAIFAAQFLREFVSEGIPWIHLDIAGVDFYREEFSVFGKGASGFAVRSCMEYVLSLR